MVHDKVNWSREVKTVLKIPRFFQKIKKVISFILCSYVLSWKYNHNIVLFVFGFNALTGQNKMLGMFENFYCSFEIHLNEFLLKNFVWKLLNVCIHTGLPTIGAKLCKFTCLICSSGKTTHNLNEMWLSSTTLKMWVMSHKHSRTLQGQPSVVLAVILLFTCHWKVSHQGTVLLQPLKEIPRRN